MTPVPQAFYDAFYAYLPPSMVAFYTDILHIDFKVVTMPIIDDYLENDTLADREKRYQYYYYIKRKHTKDNLKNHQLIDKITGWSTNNDSLIFQFPHPEILTKMQLEKGILYDTQTMLTRFIDDRYSGNKHLIHFKSTSYLISSAFFGGGKEANPATDEDVDLSVFENPQVPEVKESSIKLFTEDDARLINHLFNLSFEQLLHQKTVEFKLVDLTQSYYGNVFSKNKAKVKERLLRLNRYGIRRHYVADDGKKVDESLTFIPHIKIEQDKKDITVHVEFSAALRTKLIEHSVVRYLSSTDDHKDKYKSPYAYLINQLLLEKRFLYSDTDKETFTLQIPFTELTTRIQFDQGTFNKDLLAALKEIKTEADHLVDYRIQADSINCTLTVISKHEIDFLKNASQKFIEISN